MKKTMMAIMMMTVMMISLMPFTVSAAQNQESHIYLVGFRANGEAVATRIYRSGHITIVGNLAGANGRINYNGRSYAVAEFTDAHSGGFFTIPSEEAVAMHVVYVRINSQTMQPVQTNQQAQVNQTQPTDSSSPAVSIDTQHAQSSITLPNRRLTTAERQAWIDDYNANGGAVLYELEIVKRINEVRIQHGLNPVQIDETLMMAARFYAQTLDNLNLPLSHNVGPYKIPGATHGASRNVADAFGANMVWGAGNGAAGWAAHTDVIHASQGQVNSWMNSPGHRDYILTSKHRFIGVGSFGKFTYLFLSANPSN